MRIAPCLLALALMTSPFTLTSTPVAAQQPIAHPTCDGDFNIVRISEIKLGMMQKFLDAVAAQQAWYKNTGTPDQISVMRVFDKASGAYSTTEAITSHVEPGNRAKGPAHDAGYDAFVALFKESSTIKSEYITCIVK